MGVRLDDNTEITESGGTRYVSCVHCARRIAPVGGNYYEHLAYREGKASEAGPQIWANSKTYIDKEVVFRQYFCPGCFTAFLTEVVPVDHVDRADEPVP